MKESKYMHPEAVYEQLSIMGQTGQTLLRNLLAASTKHRHFVQNDVVLVFLFEKY